MISVEFSDKATPEMWRELFKRDWKPDTRVTLYHAYLKSEAWRRKRAATLMRARGVCQGCQHDQATQVHHKTYANLGNELNADLEALCGVCHETEHREESMSELLRQAFENLSAEPIRRVSA